MMIEAITITIAVVGSILIFMLFARIRSVSADMKLKKHRSTQAGLNDLLNYAAVVDDGVIVCKSGAFTAAFLYKGDDNSSSTAQQRNMISARINQALANLGSGWAIHVDAVRRNAPRYSEVGVSSFADPVCAAMDEERRRLFENLGTMYEGYFVLTLTWFPPRLAQQKFVELMFDDDSVQTDKKSRTNDLIEQFKREIKNIETRLSSAVQLTRLKGEKVVDEHGNIQIHDGFLSWLQFCISGDHQPMVLPKNPIYLDAIIGGKELYSGVVPKIGRKFIQVVAIEGFPLESSPGILSALAEQRCQYRWSSRFIFMDQHESVQHLEKFRKEWRQKVRGFFDQVFNTGSGRVDQDALSMVNDAEGAITDIKSGMVGAGYYTSVVVLMHENRETLEESARNIEKEINRLGFAARLETVNTLDAFLGSLPAHCVENIRRPLINTMNFADFLPVSTIWTGNANAPCPMYPPQSPALMHCVTGGATPFRLNLHVRDLGHTFMFGPTGAGKSTHLAMIAAQLRRYKDMSIYAFDKGMSMYPLTAAINAGTKGQSGLHFTIAGDNDRLAFCPLKDLKEKSDRAWAAEWIETIIALNLPAGERVTPEQSNEIAESLNSMNDSGSRSLSDFVTTIQDTKIRSILHQYTIDGIMGHLLDAEEDGLSLSDFTCFEIEELMNLDEKYALPVLLYLFRRIERSLKGKPAVIILDEAWLMLGHEAFRAKIREWLKVLRKANCLVLMATQSLSDATNSGIFDVIVESTATKIFLPNVHARDDEASALYRRMGLNARQIEILAQAEPKRQYYYASENGRRLYDLALGPLALAFVASSDKESVAEIQVLQAKFGYGWVDEWLAMKGLRLNDFINNEGQY
jgi:type IV secretion/conjugal transfer VirB4 family ATPase